MGSKMRKWGAMHSSGGLNSVYSTRSNPLDSLPQPHLSLKRRSCREIASMKFELQHVQAQIDAMNSGEAAPSQESTVSKLEASVGQVARQAISAQGMDHPTCLQFATSDAISPNDLK